MGNLLFENRINKLIIEELGISDKLQNNIIPSFISMLKSEIRKAQMLVSCDGYETKRGRFKFKLLDDIKVVWQSYYFKNKDEYIEFISANNSLNGIMFDDKMLLLTMFYVNNKPVDNKFYDTIGHELEHLYQQLLMKKDFNNLSIYNVAKSNINSKNDYSRYLAWIIYASTKSEQEAMINGAYAEFRNGDFIEYSNIDDFINNSECAIWINNLYEAYNFIKNNHNEKLLNEIAKYRKVKDYYNYKYFLYIARNGIKNFERRLSRLIILIKGKLLNEHTIIDNNIRDLVEYYKLKTHGK